MEKKIEEMAQDIAQAIDDVHAGCRLTDCEDCRYFDNTLEMCKPYAIAERLDALDYRKQTEDVVPRAEVEEWKATAEAYQKMFEDSYQAKQEIVREIFEETEKEIKEAMNFVKQNYAETENALWQAQYVGLNQARYIVLDAKKKYIGE